MGVENNGENKEDMAVRAGLMMVKKQMEEKSGKVSHDSNKKKSNDQTELLKKLRDKKKRNKEFNFDIFTLKRTYLYSENAEVQDVIEFIKEKLWDAPKDLSLINILAVSYIVSNDFSKAEFELKKGLNIDKNNLDLNYNMAELLVRKGNVKESLEFISNLIRLDKEDLNALYLMGLCFYIAGSSAQAINIVAQGLKADKEFQRVHKNFTFLSLLKLNLDKSEDILKKLLEKSVKNISERVVLQEIYLHKNKIEEYENEDKLIANVVLEKEVIQRPCFCVNKGELYRIQGDGEKALESLNNAIQINPHCICAYIAKIRLMFQNKKFDEGYEQARKVLAWNQNSCIVMAELVKYYFYHNKETDADEFVSKILQKEKGYVMTIKNKGNVLYRIELEKMKDKFSRNLNAILSKYKSEESDFFIECDTELMILKLFRDIKLCEIIYKG